jgi:hypothetical protein
MLHASFIEREGLMASIGRRMGSDIEIRFSENLVKTGIRWFAIMR